MRWLDSINRVNGHEFEQTPGERENRGACHVAIYGLWIGLSNPPSSLSSPLKGSLSLGIGQSSSQSVVPTCSISIIWKLVRNAFS